MSGQRIRNQAIAMIHFATKKSAKRRMERMEFLQVKEPLLIIVVQKGGICWMFGVVGRMG